MTIRDLLNILIVKAMVAEGHHAVRAMHRNTVDARKKNEKLLLRILKENKATEYGRKYGFAEIQTAEDFRRKVPLSTYADYEPYITRMVEGDETGLITAKRIVGYAQSSGTVGGAQIRPHHAGRGEAVYPLYGFQDAGAGGRS